MNWQSFWQKRSIAQCVLLPLSALFFCIIGLRKMAYRLGLLKSQRASLPVVVIGNINIGGAGKTPLVIALGRLLDENGIRYAIVSKGYGGSYEQPMSVSADDLASVVGDEPLLMKIKLDCPLVVAKSRIEACELVAKNYPDVQIILSDDGLQHYALHRDIEVCVVNHSIGLGNGWLLPAGGLREPPSRLKSVDFMVSNGDANANYHYILADRGWHNIHTPMRKTVDEFSNNPADHLVMTGIAHPTLFFNRVTALGINADNKAFPDHHRFTETDLPKDKTLFITEKDWVKIKQFNHPDAWYLAVEAVLNDALTDDFLAQIKPLIGEKK